MQLEPFSRLEKGAWHPAGGQTQESAGRGNLGFDGLRDILIDGLERSNGVHWQEGKMGTKALEGARYRQVRAQTSKKKTDALGL
jgi:hypothetical protein